MPASDLVEGTLNNAERPPVKSRDGQRELFAGEAIPHFNEVDECAGLDALITYRVHKRSASRSKHAARLRWGDATARARCTDYVWVFLISGSAPPAHFGGWHHADGHRQPAMYFPNGGSTLRGISKPGEIVWSRIFVEDDVAQDGPGPGQRRRACRRKKPNAAGTSRPSNGPSCTPSPTASPATR